VLAELQSAHALRLRYVREGDDRRQFHVDALDGIPVTEVDIEALNAANASRHRRAAANRSAAEHLHWPDRAASCSSARLNRASCWRSITRV
jgi:hypothetical protein